MRAGDGRATEPTPSWRSVHTATAAVRAHPMELGVRDARPLRLGLEPDGKRGGRGLQQVGPMERDGSVMPALILKQHIGHALDARRCILLGHPLLARERDPPPVARRYLPS